MGPRKLVFHVLAEFANEVKLEAACQLVPSKCKVYCKEEGAWEVCIQRRLIPPQLQNFQEGIVETPQDCGG